METPDQHWLDMNLDEISTRARERFGTVSFEVLGYVRVLWSSWECDHTAVLIELADGWREVVILGETSVGAPVDLRERLAEYRRAAAETEAFLTAHGRRVQISFDPIWHAEHAISIAVAVSRQHGADRDHLVAHAPLLYDGGHVAVVDLPDGRRVPVTVRAPEYAAEDLPLQAARMRMRRLACPRSSGCWRSLAAPETPLERRASPPRPGAG